MAERERRARVVPPEKERREAEAAQKAADDETKAAEEKRKAEEAAEIARKKAEDAELARQSEETPAQTALRLATNELDEARDEHSAMQHEIDPFQCRGASRGSGE